MTTEPKPCPMCGKKAKVICHAYGDEVLVACFDHDCGIRTLWHATEKDAIDSWNRRTPDHIPDVREMVDPMTSVVTWTRYDGTPETLPPILKHVLVKDALHTMKIGVLNHWLGDDLIWDGTCGVESVQIGDLWSYLPKPPEAAQ